jgi:hypothetical protein
VAVEVLWWKGCPSTDETIALVREQMADAGLDPAALRVREIRTEAEAAAVDFRGSPTVRVDGRDIVDPVDEPLGLTCRVYTLADGRISALPDPAHVASALARVTGG